MIELTMEIPSLLIKLKVPDQLLHMIKREGLVQIVSLKQKELKQRL